MRRLFQELDPRTRVLSIVCATLIVASTPSGVVLPFAAYFPLCLLFLLTDRVSGAYLLWRCLMASPFILLASGMLAVQDGLVPEELRARMPQALGVAGKGYAAVLLLAFLTASTALSDLLTALRRMGIPESLSLILGMMSRYTSLLSEEYARMERARECRTVRPLGKERFRVYARQLGALILRSLDRGERVHAAMLARGFDGSWPGAQLRSFRLVDWFFLFSSTVAFLTARLTL